MKYPTLIFLACIPFLLISSVQFLKDPPVWPDETSFFDMSQTFSKSGRIATSIYGNIAPGIENTDIGYPPLYFIIQSYWANLFGTEIETLRLLSLFFAISSLVLFFFIAKKLFNSNSLAFLGTVILSLDIHFSRASRLARMEILTFFFVVSSLLTILIAQKIQKNILYFLAGIISAFATISHTMGFIAPVILTLFILFERKTIRQKLLRVILILTPVLISNILWFAATGKNIGHLIGTYSLHSADKMSKLPFAFTLFSVDLSWKILFISYMVIIFIFILSLKKSSSKMKLFIFSGFIASVIFTLMGKEGGYIIYFQPFLTLIILYTLKNLRKDIEMQNLGKAFISITSVLIIIAGYLNIEFFQNDSLGITNKSDRSVFGGSYDYHDFSKRIIDVLPKDKPVTLFLSATPDPYFDLKKLNNFKFYLAAAPYTPISNSEYKKILDSSDYLILTWVPHQFLADYINQNSDSITNVGQPNGYSAAVVKLKPKDDRI